MYEGADIIRCFTEKVLQTRSDAQVDKSWRDVYLVHPSLNTDWYGILGNHDYQV